MKHYKIQKKKYRTILRIPEVRCNLPRPILPRKLFTKVHEIVNYEMIMPEFKTTLVALDNFQVASFLPS